MISICVIIPKVKILDSAHVDSSFIVIHDEIVTHVKYIETSNLLGIYLYSTDLLLTISYNATITI